MRTVSARTVPVLPVALLALLLTSLALPERLGAADAPPVAVNPSAPLVHKLAELGSTRKLEVLPLVDWHSNSPALRGEAGVAYLVRTDTHTILFDVGGNLQASDPSPLLANMQQLGIKLSDIDTIVISHAHMDHVGGQANAMKKTFSLGTEQVELAGKRVFVPTRMTYPGITPVLSAAPTVIAPGVASTGSITGKLHIGPVDEQALAIRVEGKGIVLIVGCGHQGLSHLLERTQQLFDEPIYGLVGGLHYPIPSGRWMMSGIDVQRWAVYGTAPGPSAQDVQQEATLLLSKGLQWVSLSPHDSSDEMIELFRKGFGPRYHDLRVGEAQVIGTLGR